MAELDALHSAIVGRTVSEVDTAGVLLSSRAGRNYPVVLPRIESLSASFSMSTTMRAYSLPRISLTRGGIVTITCLNYIDVAGSGKNSSTAVVSRDMTMYVSWVAGTTDGVAAER